MQVLPIKQLPRDLYQRYDRSFLRYMGEVYYCRVMNDSHEDEEGYIDEGEPMFSLRRLTSPDDEVHWLNPYTSDVDQKSVSLGYLNHPEGCIYIKRTPYRQWKQTVSADMIENQIGGLMWTPEMERMFRGEYPSLERAIELLEVHGWKEVAISREFMVRRLRKNSVGLQVFFKGLEIGSIPDYKNNLVLVIKDRKTSWALSPYLINISWRVEND